MPIIPNNTLSSIVNLVNRANSEPAIEPPLSHARFALASSGLASFFGGDSALRAIASTYFIPGRRWLGWYNAPGAYEVAKQFSGIVKSLIFDALFPTGDSDPGKIFTVVDRQIDPEYIPLHPSTGNAPPSIGPLALLIARKISQMGPPIGMLSSQTGPTMDVRVTFVKLRDIPGSYAELKPCVSSFTSIIFPIITILISLGGCIACVFVADWFCFASIAVGIIANGIAWSVIGSGKLYLKHNPSSQPQIPGDVLLRTDTDITVLLGNEGAVLPVTHGRLFLRPYGKSTFWVRSIYYFNWVLEAANIRLTSVDDRRETSMMAEPPSFSSLILHKSLIHISVILLLFQFLAQLLLIPQGTLFGQLMFVGTLVSSWVYHLYMSTRRLDLQTEVLFQQLSIQEKNISPHLQLNTWLPAAVFACLTFRANQLAERLSSSTNADEPPRSDDMPETEIGKEGEEAEGENFKAKKRNLLKPIREMAIIAKTEEEQVAVDAGKAAEEAAFSVPCCVANAATEARIQAQDAHAEVETAKNEEEDQRFPKVLEKMEEVAEKNERETMLEKIAANAPVDAANQAAAMAKAADAAHTEMSKKVEEDGTTVLRNKAAQQEENENNALKALIDALLPDQTDAWRAFKQSLMKKLSNANDNNSAWTYMEGGATFKFHREEDVRFRARDGKTLREVRGKDLEELLAYQKNIENAFIAWRHSGKLCRMVEWLRQ